MFTATLEGEAEFAAQIRAFEAALRHGAEEAVGAACKAGIDTAKRGAFKDHTTDLRRQLYWVYTQSSNTGTEAEMRSPMKYSSYVEEGTQPHEIRSRGETVPVQGPAQKGRKGVKGVERSMLRWEAADGTHFARVVHHSGSKSIPFMGPAYQTAERVLNACMELVAAEAGKVFT